MRFYTFGNYYLSSLQQGLQGTHVLGEIYSKYAKNTEGFKSTHNWAKNHKTIVMLNGGNSLSLQAIFDKFKTLNRKGMQLPFAKFHEDEQSLGGALTCVGIVVPEHLYSFAPSIRGIKDETEILAICKFKGFKVWEAQLMILMNSYDLAK